MVLDASCHISYRSNAPIPAIMILRPRSGYAQWITQEEYAFEPHAPVVEYTDNFGNLCQRVLIPKGNFEVRCSCRAHTADVVDVDPKAGFVPVQEPPESALQLTRNLNIPARMAVGYLYQIPGLTRYEVAQRLREISENQERHVSGYYRMGHSRSVGSGNI